MPHLIEISWVLERKWMNEFIKSVLYKIQMVRHDALVFSSTFCITPVYLSWQILFLCRTISMLYRPYTVYFYSHFELTQWSILYPYPIHWCDSIYILNYLIDPVKSCLSIFHMSIISLLLERICRRTDRQTYTVSPSWSICCTARKELMKTNHDPV
jgi:hypothetical protein